MRGPVAATLCTLALASCSSSTSTTEDQPPTLEVTAPERASTSTELAIRVTGRVTDDRSGVRVTVNGVDASVEADGSFSASVNVEDGIGVIETHAIDSGSNDVRDVRSVLAGTLGQTDGSVGGVLAARVSANGFQKIGTVLAATAQALDWKAMALAMNPVSTGSGCNSVRRVDIQDLTVGTINVGLPPAEGKLNVGVTIANVYVRVHVDFEALCIKGSATADVRSTLAHIDGGLAFAVANGQLSASLPTSAVTLDGFSLDINNVPGAIESLVKGKVRDAAESALSKAIRDKVPQLVNEQLGGLLAKPIDTKILDRATSIAITPSAVTVTTDGLVASVDGRVHVEGGEGGLFAASPSPLSAGVWQAGDLGVALAGDLMNQLFGGLWASGAIAPTLKLEGAAGVLAAILDDDARSIAITLSLPPTVRARNGALELAIGDLMLSVRDQSDVEIQRFALTVQTSLAAAPDMTGALHVSLGTPTIKAQVILQTEAVDTPITGEKLEGLVSGAWGLIGGQFDGALGNLPLPKVSGVSFGAPTLGGREGFLVIDMPIQ